MTNLDTSPRAEQFRGISNESAQRLLEQRAQEAYQRQTAAPAPKPVKSLPRSLTVGPDRMIRGLRRGLRGRSA